MRILRWLLLPPAVVLGISIGASNRDMATLRLEPLPYAIDVPLYMVIFGAGFAGMLIGALAMWWRDGRVRRKVRAEHHRVRDLEKELAREHDELARVRKLARGEGTEGEPRRLEGPKAA